MDEVEADLFDASLTSRSEGIKLAQHRPPGGVACCSAKASPAACLVTATSSDTKRGGGLSPCSKLCTSCTTSHSVSPPAGHLAAPAGIAATQLWPHNAAYEIPLMNILIYQAHEHPRLMNADWASSRGVPPLCGAARQLQHNRVQHLSSVGSFCIENQTAAGLVCQVHHYRYD